MEMIILIGIAASGKTTWSKKCLPHHVRISLDDIKSNKTLEDKMIISELEKGNNIVIDDTNLTADIRQRHIKIAKKYGAVINAIYFCIDIQRAHKQNFNREKNISYYALNKQKKQLEMPNNEEGFDHIQFLNI